DFLVGGAPSSLVSADFNGDGKADFATANYDVNTVSVRLGTGTGSFIALEELASDYGGNPQSITSADFNKDGKADLVVADGGVLNKVSIFLGIGTIGLFSAPINFTSGSLPVSVTTADFNGDGKVDLVAANQTSGCATILLNTSPLTTPGCFNPLVNFAAGRGNNPSSITNADFNRDGNIDMAVALANLNSVCVFLSNGSGGFGGGTIFPTGSIPVSVISADVNGDGHADLITANYNSNNISVLLGNGSGSFIATSSPSVGSHPKSVASADFNRDGIADLAVANYSSNTISILLGIGNGLGLFSSATNFGAGTGPSSVTSADFNKDGKADLAITNETSNSVTVILGTGTGSFGTATNHAVGSTPVSIISGDFNRDGNIDLATANYSSNNLSVLLGTGTGSFGAATNQMVGNNPYSVISADINGDGYADLATANAGSTTVSVLLNSGSGLPTGLFGAATNHTVGANPYSITSADFNKDGIVDLATANNGSSNVSVLEGISCSGLTGRIDNSSDKQTQSISSDRLTSIANLNTEQALSIYPNPSNGNFVIETNTTDIQTLQVFDINGKVVLSQTISGTATIDASNLNEGIYNISIINSQSLVNKKMIITK
ncbi:MAG TPA: T9SS type A sorting domain-containing protein, partial [Bacteroidia bacterium]|nr:T9SS type A sorting domain-containing protein [Bacteroidia bacterium]